jgi:nucleoside-diphosphate-sugar epimerase
LNDSSKLQRANILVTGATGFIGGRLVEYLVLHYKANVRALIRNHGHAVHLARLPVQLIPGDVLNIDSVRNAVKGCDFVFHCAAGMKGEDIVRYKTTVEGTKNMLEASMSAKVKRFVHVSTIAIHGPDPGLEVHENSPILYGNDVYADSKIDAEKLVFQYYSEKGLPIVVIRPTIVYGPRSGSWTLEPLDNIKKQRLALIEDGSGIANYIFVDDVVQMLLSTAICSEAIGEAFIASHGTGVTWKEFFGYYARMLGVKLPSITVKTINQQQKQLNKLHNPITMGLSFIASPHAQSVLCEMPLFGAGLNIAANAIPDSWKRSILDQAKMARAIKLNPPKLPGQSLIAFYCAKGVCKIEKAQRILGYQPQFSLEKGMQLTEDWLRYTKLI